jgi:hypothetical protein
VECEQRRRPASICTSAALLNAWGRRKSRREQDLSGALMHDELSVCRYTASSSSEAEHAYSLGREPRAPSQSKTSQLSLFAMLSTPDLCFASSTKGGHWVTR